MRNSKGFTLITVLILTSMATLVVLSSLRDTIIQERLSGNYQKQLNARLMAEKGVYASMQQLNQQLLNDPTQNLADLVNQNASINGIGTLDATAFNANLTVNNDGELVISSTGNRFEGEANLEAIFEFVQTPGSTGSSPFSPGITGCSGISLSGSGKIDSYDSSLGDYNATLSDGSQNYSEQAFVQTLDGDSTIVLSGNGKIFGDVIASNSIKLTGSADISGNVHSNGYLSLPSNSKIGGNVTAYLYYSQQSGSVGGNIQANGDISLKQTYVAGNITSGANIAITGNTIDGKVLSQGDTTLNQPTILGGVQSHGNYSQKGGTVSGGVKVLGNVALTQWGSTISSDDLRYLGNGSFTGDTPEYYLAPYKTSPPLVIDTISPVKKIDFTENGAASGTTSCDPLGINNAINDLDDPLNNYQDLFISGSGKGDHLQLFTSKAEFLVDNASTPDSDITAKSTRFLDKPTDIMYFDNISIKGHLSVKENHHATLFVQGDFTMSGASSLTIPEQSSLTIIVLGKFNIGAGTQVYTPTNGITALGKPVFSIYSNYSGNDTGVSFSGGTEQAYAVIYAPLSHVEITSSVGFKGSVLGNTVNVSGAGGIHYDTALADVSAGGGSTSSSSSHLVFKGWRYAVEENKE
ncbi:hypothetical protein RC083_12190 [Pseudoalteromonas haloplanktis]|uniref:Uncharacterized protein n=1 Tax=Pseudoalteromonas haloplanktis TaxID=228 RepID=A0ABU1BDP2_PSEHA|nr:PilX N-terminal domain-containing pilus assembly protein [Pseudoalteromonas haloplanktis]MDQ9092347.1 hypothetical protein [Pseudoalteromonas haloplanktis]